MTKQTDFDVVIIGGSYAGLSAAMALGRSLRSVLIIDAGDPCNKQTPRSHNFITQDGATPASISTKAKQQVLAYASVQFLYGFATHGKKTEDGFEIIIRSGKSFRAGKLIFATGIKDVLPDINGFGECWGITAVHCPYCHGYEVRKVKTGILANGEAAFETAKLISNWTDKLTLFTNGKSGLNDAQMHQLGQKDIAVIEKSIRAIEHEEGYIKALKFKEGTTESLQALYARVPFTQHSNIPSTLGCTLDEQGYIAVDRFQKTSIQGVFACGDNTTFIRSVAQAVYAGNVAASSLNKELIERDWIA